MAQVWQARGEIKEGVYPWPVWGPLPEPLAPGGNWQTGLATGLVGAMVGTFFLRCVGFLFSAGLGREALGLGDADLMMMAGAFLGWQIVVVSFFLSVLPAAVFGVTLLVLHRDRSLPFGPSLALAVLVTMLGWHWLASPGLRLVFFWWQALLILVVFGLVFLVLMSLILRLVQAPLPPPTDGTSPPDDRAPPPGDGVPPTAETMPPPAEELPCKTS
jgi:leader peptidase (prepilin peptidase) / N-methyltransferase